MAEDQLRDVIDGIRTRLQAEVEAQLGTLNERHEQAIERARQAAEAGAEQRWAPKVDATRAEWAARLQSEVAAARSEVERTMVAESMRVRVEAEQAAAEGASEARRELEQAVAAEHQRAQAQIEAERQRAQAQVEAERKRAQAQVEAERQRAQAQVETERQRAARELTQAQAAFEAERAQTAEAIEEAARRAPVSLPSSPDLSSLLEAVRAIDSATSLSDALAAAVRGAAAEAPRAALFLVTGQDLAEWPVSGVPSVHAGPLRADGREAGILGEAVRRGETIWTGPGGNGLNPPAFAELPGEATALASPVMLAGQPVAVLYADAGVNGDAPKAWRDPVQILARHATAAVAYLTAVRTAQAMQLSSGAAASSPAPAPSSTEDDQGARRYARLLMSEIKLYNEGAVRTGCERRDLLQRLKPEIDRARVLYEERISVGIGARDIYFHQELLQTLAGGDQSLLGSP